MPWTIAVLFLYGALNIVLGILGFVRAHSVISLVAGGAAGVLVMIAASVAKTNPRLGFGLALLIGLLLLGKFGGPMFSKPQVYPGGIMVVASLIAMLAAGLGLAGKA